MVQSGRCSSPQPRAAGGNLKAHSSKADTAGRQPAQLYGTTGSHADLDAKKRVSQQLAHQHALNIQKALQGTMQQADPEVLQPQRRSQLCQSLQAPLSGPEMFTPMPTAAPAARANAAAGAGASHAAAAEEAAACARAAWAAADGSPGRTRSNSTSPQRAALQAAAAIYKQLQQEWQQQQDKHLQQRQREAQHQQHQQQAANSMHARTSAQPPPQRQQHAVYSAEMLAASLKLTPELHQQLLILQKQRQLQQRYQQRGANQQYALRARTPSPLRSTSPTQPQARSLTPPRQAAARSSMPAPGAGTGAGVFAAAVASRVAGMPARLRRAVSGYATGGSAAAGAGAKASAASANASMEAAQQARLAKAAAGANTSTGRTVSKRTALPVVNSAGLSLRPGSKTSNVAGTHAAGRPAANSSGGKGKSGGTAATDAAVAGASRSKGASAAAAQSRKAVADNGAPVHAAGNAQRAARAAVAASIVAQAGTLGYKTGSTGQLHISAAVTEPTTQAVQPAAAGAAAGGGAGQQWRGSKLQQLKHCNQRLRQSLQQKQQLQQQQPGHAPQQQQQQQQAEAESSNGGMDAAPVGLGPVQRVDIDAAGVHEGRQPQEQSRQTWRQLSNQQQQQQQQQVPDVAADASEEGSPPFEHSSSSLECSEAAHVLQPGQPDHHQYHDRQQRQRQRQQQEAGGDHPAQQAAMLVHERSGGSVAAGVSPGSDSFLQNERAAAEHSGRFAANAPPALAAESSGSSLSQVEQQWQQLQQFVDAAGDDADASWVAQQGLEVAEAQYDAASRSGSEDGDTGSSISFMAAKPTGAQQQQQQQQTGLLQQQQQLQEGLGSQGDAADVEWPPRKHLRTALFASPTPEQQRGRGRQRNGLSGNAHDSAASSISSRSSSPACSWIEEDEEDAADAAEQQMQLLLNNTARQAPESPSWVSAAGQKQHTAAKGQLHSPGRHQHPQQQQQQVVHVLGRSAHQQQQQGRQGALARSAGHAGVAGGYDRRESIGPKLSQAEEDFLQLLEGAQAATVEAFPSPTAAAAAGGAPEGDQLGKIMQQQVSLWAASHQNQQQQQLHQEASSSSQGVLSQPPWRPPGVTPSISSPPPPIVGGRPDRASAGTSSAKKQYTRQRVRNGSTSRSRSRSPVQYITVVHAPGRAKSPGTSPGADHAHEATGVRSALRQRQQQLQQMLEQREGQQGQEQPTSYQVQLQAYLDAQQQQQQQQRQYFDAQHHQQHQQQENGVAECDYDQQQPDQQQEKRWQQRGSPGPAHSSPKPLSGHKVAQTEQCSTRSSQQQQQQQEEEEVRYRLSLPEGCQGSDGDDALVDWAAAALDAVAAGPGTGVPAQHTSGMKSGHSAGVLLQDAVSMTAAAAAVDPDAVAEEFAALLETGQQQLRCEEPLGLQPQQQQQQQEEGVQQSSLEAWGSKVDVGQHHSSGSSGGMPRRTEASFVEPAQQLPGPQQQQQQQQQQRSRRNQSAGRLREEDSEQAQLRAMCRAVDAAISETAVAFRQYWLLRRAFKVWARRCVSAERTRLLLRDANRASAEAFAATRQQRLLSHCWSGWTAAVVVGSSARSAATQLLQKVVQRQALSDWRLAALSDRALKQDVLRAWNAHVQEQQADKLQLEIAELHCYQRTLQKAWRAWVITWCKAASARMLATQIAAKQKAAVLSALANNAACQRQKRAAALRADTFRRARLLLLCLRWWKGWARYSRVLQFAGAEVQASARERVLREVLAAWQGYARFRAWKAEAIEAAEGFYWSRLATTVLGAWRQTAAECGRQDAAAAGFAEQRQRRLLAAMLQEWQHWAQVSARAAAALRARQQRLLQGCLHEWWMECVGNKRAFEMQVQGLVRLVTAAFKAWRQLVAEQRQQQQQQLEMLVAQAEQELLPAESSGSRVGEEEEEEGWEQGHGGGSGGSSGSGSIGSLVAQYTQTLEQQKQHRRSQGTQQQQQQQGDYDTAGQQNEALLRQVLMGWCGFVGLRKMWRSEAPLLAAAYYQGKLLKRAWGAWVISADGSQQQQQRRQQCRQQDEQEGEEGAEEQQQWDGVVRVGMGLAGEQQWQQEQGEESCGTAESAVCHPHLNSHPPHRQQQRSNLARQQQQQQEEEVGEEEEGGHAEGMYAEESCSTVPCAEPSLQEILMCPSAGTLDCHGVDGADQQHHHQHTSSAAAGAEEEASQGAASDAAAGAVAAAASKMTGRGKVTAAMFVAAEADIDAWRAWQQQQQEQQLEALQSTAAEAHYLGAILRRVFAAWFRTAAAGAALMSQQAQLKHSVQLQLVQVVKQQQLAAAHVRERLVERPFRCWMQVVLLKSSAASGFRSYQLLFKGFLGWREVVMHRKQQQQQQQQQQLDLCLVMQPKQARDAAGVQPSQQQQQQLQAAAQPAVAAAAITQAPHLQQGQQTDVQMHQLRTVGTASRILQQHAARAARISAGGDESMALCQPVQLEDSACSIHHAMVGLELTASEAAFVEAHHSMTRQELVAVIQQQQQQQRAPTGCTFSRQALEATGHVLNVGAFRSPPVSGGGCDPAAAAAAGRNGSGAVGAAGAGSSGGISAAAAASESPVVSADVVAARLASVLRQQQQQQQGAQPAQWQQEHQQQQQQQGSQGAEEDLRSSFGDFTCLQDLKNILDSC